MTESHQVSNTEAVGSDSVTSNRERPEIVEIDLQSELHDVFHVTALTAGTPLESTVGADHVRVEPGSTSNIHRHNVAETVLFMLDGSGVVDVEDVDHAVSAGDRIIIRAGQFHGVRTDSEPLTFISVQTPPILDQAGGEVDLEPRQTGV